MEYITGITTNSKGIPNPLSIGESIIFFKDVTEQIDSVLMKGYLTIGLFIQSDSEDEFLRIVDLLFSSLAVISGQPYVDCPEILNKIMNQNTQHISLEFKMFLPYEILPACHIVKKAYNQKFLEIAVLKFNIAHDLYSIDIMHYDPHINEPNFIYLPSNQIKIATAITTLYSIFEELNINIKASSENPSTLNDGQDWNPVVYQSLMERLSSFSINIDDRISWIFRGELNRPFKKCINVNEMCEWSNGIDIKDYNIKISDAILEVSFMRSKMASHGIANRIDMLNEKDLVNASFLARHILLSICDINSITY
jgi:hypothetical protein